VVGGRSGDDAGRETDESRFLPFFILKRSADGLS